MKNSNKLLLTLGGFGVGVLNGLFGAGGGALMVPLLAKSGLDTKRCHAGAIAVILPITLLSAALYLKDGHVTPAEALPYIPGGLIGSVIGAVFLKKIANRWLKGAFGVLIVIAGVRMLLA